MCLTHVPPRVRCSTAPSEAVCLSDVLRVLGDCSLLDLVVRRAIVDTEAVLSRTVLPAAHESIGVERHTTLTRCDAQRRSPPPVFRLPAGTSGTARCVAAKCKTCKEVTSEEGGTLLACCFCTSYFHNKESCLGAAAVTGPRAVLTRAPTFTCPQCYTKGMAKHAQHVLQPTGARVAGVKRGPGRGRGRGSK